MSGVSRIVQTSIQCLISVASLFLSHQLLAAESPNIEQARTNLEKLFPVQSIIYVDDLHLYQVQLQDGTYLFSNLSGKQFVVGAMYSVENNRPINVTERDKDKERVKAVASIERDDLIIFPADSATVGSMYVFTDIDCTYCRRLHSEMDIYTSNGIEVRYIAWPRCGTGTNCQSYEKAVSVWCADDPLTAMTLAKTGATPDVRLCDNPVKDQYELGVKLGLRGTPFIILDDGTTIPGYKPASEIIQILTQS